MSKLGSKTIEIPSEVTLTLDKKRVEVKGPKGTLSTQLSGPVEVKVDGNQLNVSRKGDSRRAKEAHGTARSLIQNLIEGVVKGYEEELEMKGIGYRAALEGKDLTLSIGLTHPVKVKAPEGVEFKVEESTRIFISGIDKQLVGNTAAKIQSLKPPEPYKGKGILFKGQQVTRKAGKAAKVGEGGAAAGSGE